MTYKIWRFNAEFPRALQIIIIIIIIIIFSFRSLFHCESRNKAVIDYSVGVQHVCLGKYLYNITTRVDPFGILYYVQEYMDRSHQNNFLLKH